MTPEPTRGPLPRRPRCTSSLPSLLLVVLTACGAPLEDPTQLPLEPLRMNQIQVVGSHNSYKRAMRPEMMEQLRAVDPRTADSLDYDHTPLEEQLDRGLRNLELDVFWDPEGSRYAWPQGEEPAPGLRVMHVQNLDDQSHCSTFARCLDVLRTWSEDHPGHVPIAVTMNAKDQVIEREGFARPLPFDEDAWSHLDRVLRRGLAGRLIEPSEVFPDTRGEHDAALPIWPTLDAARGRFLFVLDETGPKRASYRSRWHERAMFTNTPPGEPGAAVVILNDPLLRLEIIRQTVRDGYLVRTRADADTVEARQGSTERRDAAFTSGAHWVTTDYDLPAKFGTGYVVDLPGGGVARCNPVLELDERACEALRNRPDN